MSKRTAADLLGLDSPLDRELAATLFENEKAQSKQDVTLTLRGFMDDNQLRTWRDSLIEARLKGIRRVRDQNGEEIEYKSDNEMSAAIRAADQLILETTGKHPNVIRFLTTKGL